jgi:hypothetical protein
MSAALGCAPDLTPPRRFVPFMHELLGNALMGFVINTIVDCPDEDEAKIMWLIDGMEAYAADVADIRGRVKQLLIDQWVRFDHQPTPPARPQMEVKTDDDIPF